ncbi:MAG TPA: molybdopterin-binding protein [Bacteroidia bacterium]|nr:molybdopterin-binding protein [Bacteroidia bacterium]
MKKHLFIFLVLASTFVWAQTKITPTQQFTITGKIKTELKFTLADINTYPLVAIKNVTLTNHLGEVKSDIQNIKGIALKPLLEKIEFLTDKPKDLSQFYLTFVASDNYKVVYSWNEIFNTETGNNLYIITEKDGKKLTDADGPILIITTTDFKTGRRYVKALDKIIVGRVE